MPQCKVGDLAVIIRSARTKQDCIGRIVEVVGLAPFQNWGDEPIWEIVFKGIPPASCNKPHHAAPDSYLKPIRGDSKADETERHHEMQAG